MAYRIKDLLTPAEISELTARSDWQGALAIGRAWAGVILIFVLLAMYPNPFTIALGLVLMGGQHLCFAIVTHEAAHSTLFRTRSLNDALPDWLCARPVWLDVARYREHHMRHHGHTGTDKDPDMSLVSPFPTTKASLRRKLLRDLVGLSGLRRIVGLVLMDLGFIRYNVSGDVFKLPQEGRTLIDYSRDAGKNFGPVLFTNLLLAGILMACGQGWLYLIWVVAYLTTFSLFLRIRSIAEHACMEQGSDMFRNTRTTRAGWLAKLTVAPMCVNYHKEHHLMASVPFYRLPALHRILRERGVVETPPGYREVLQTAGSA